MRNPCIPLVAGLVLVLSAVPVAVADAGFAADPEAGPGAQLCIKEWVALTGDCSPCHTLARIAKKLGLPTPVCPE